MHLLCILRRLSTGQAAYIHTTNSIVIGKKWKRDNGNLSAPLGNNGPGNNSRPQLIQKSKHVTDPYFPNIVLFFLFPWISFSLLLIWVASKDGCTGPSCCLIYGTGNILG